MPAWAANASSNRCPSTCGSYASNSGSFQYCSKVAAIFVTIGAFSTWLARTFHSSPSSRAEWVRFDDPT
ncbi:MAG: hypothetical protein ACRDGQ_08865 [Candidatus Limnocylindrales bacterium]